MTSARDARTDSKDASALARRLDVVALAKAGQTLSGAWPLADFPRLGLSLVLQASQVSQVSQVSQGVPSAGGAVPQGVVQWVAQGQQRERAGQPPQTRLHLRADAHVHLECQRCLQPAPFDLHVDRAFRFVAGEDEAARLDEASDDEDVLALPVRLDLRQLTEDELILALPLVPRHAGACPQPLPITADEAVAPGASSGAGADAGAAEAPAPHPFAALAALKRVR